MYASSGTLTYFNMRCVLKVQVLRMLTVPSIPKGSLASHVFCCVCPDVCQGHPSLLCSSGYHTRSFDPRLNPSSKICA